MSENKLVYSIQQTYILTHVLTPEREIVTCNQRIDIPTIEPLPSVKPVPLPSVEPGSYDGQPLTVIPCIELAGEFLSEFNLTFETNEGVTVLPIKIASGEDDPSENPYTHFRYVLALPSGATGVRTCKLIQKATGKEVQHNFTFGIMPPPYNYDNALFGYLIGNSVKNANNIADLTMFIQYASIKKRLLRTIELIKGLAKQEIHISSGESFFYAKFDYSLSPEPTIHKPEIVVYSDTVTHTYVLSLNKTVNIVLIDLWAGMITVYDDNNYEIIQQFMLDYRSNAFTKLTFKNFDDIDSPTLTVISKGVALGA